ncbi:porin [Bartonella gliris]|uniref:porin n=1 Tax=Bartonella gliris TaxID=3004109 RepID=UPI00295E9042|nr:porin [Bartonella gliris]
MNIKSLMTTSVIALISASAAQAADVIVPREVAPVITAPAFSWTGFYLGAQVGNFSSKVEITDPATKNKLFSKDDTPKPSGFMGGIYAGSNVDLGNGLILGVETDAVWADRGETKSLSFLSGANSGTGTETPAGGTPPETPAGGTPPETPAGGTPPETPAGGTPPETPAGGTPPETPAGGTHTETTATKTAQFTRVNAAGVTPKDTFTFKEKWSGATRVRIGFAAADRIMPYIAGGIAYAQMQGVAASVTKDASGKETSKKEFDKTMTMVGYTLGGGVDFAMTDNVLLRAEYRYSDFGKKKFKDSTPEFHYKTNDFRVGVAYKF